MSIKDLSAELESLLRKAPDPQKIATCDAARSFKKAVAEAKKQRTEEKLRMSLMVLKGYYK